MRISRFELAAVGPFTGKVLEFPEIEADLHVIHGPNEAGKSSALRAFKAWLFGFPERTRDDFIHPRSNMLVGGELCRAGRCLEFFRRKKRKGDIVDREGSPLDPALLTPFLGGLDIALFESLYAIDHEILVQGGREILARKGELGETLFSAGAGLGSLHKALERMEVEKAELYKVKGKNQKINQRIRLHKTLRREIRELSFAPEAWEQYAETYDRLGRELEEMNVRRQRLDQERLHLERLHRAAPLLARRREIQRQLLDLGSLRILPSDFGRRRSTVQQELRSERQRLDLLQARKELIVVELDRLSPQTALVGWAAKIEEVFQRLGAYKKAREDRPHRAGMRAILLKEADQLLQTIMPDLGTDDARIFLPLVRQKKKILALAAEHGLRVKTVRDAELRLAAVQEELRQTAGELEDFPRPVPSDPLQAAINRALKGGDLDQRITGLNRELTIADRALQATMQRLAYWQGTVAELIGLKLVPTAAIRKFDAELEDLLHQENQIAEKEQVITDELLQIKTRMRELTLGGEVPSEAELVRVRKRRDHGWRLLCRHWLGREDIESALQDFSPEGELHETVHALIQQADGIGDRLRFEADRVQTFASLQAKEKELRRRRRDNKRAREELTAVFEEHGHKWNRLWQPLGIIPSSPDEMVQWQAEVDKLQQQAISLTSRQAELDRMRQQRSELRQAMVSELAIHNLPGLEDESLDPVLASGQVLLENLHQARQEYEQLCREHKRQQGLVRQSELELEQRRREHQEWQRRWRKLATLADRNFSFSPDDAQDLFDTIAGIDTRIKEAAELESRMRGMDRDCAEFEREVDALAQKVAPELTGGGAEQIVSGLYDLMTIAGKEQTLYEQYNKELQSITGELAETELSLKGSRRELDTLLALAGCTREEELIRAEQKSEEHARLTEQLRQVEQDLQQIAGELSITVLSRQLGKVDCDALPGQLHALTQEIRRELDPAIQNLAEQKGEARKMLEHMDGSGKAARKAEELQDNLAHLHKDAQRYLRLQVGVELLRREIEKFRRRNQGPILTHASRIFAELTLGSFSGLKTDVDGRGEPVLVGIRADSRLPVDVAAMSTGSRDQLYLALRLASLRHRAEQGHPMPYIFDDILINFDDERSSATLNVLAGLGGENQLILFTHQSQVARQAEQIAGVAVHHLKK